MVAELRIGMGSVPFLENRCAHSGARGQLCDVVFTVNCEAKGIQKAEERAISGHTRVCPWGNSEWGRGSGSGEWQRVSGGRSDGRSRLKAARTLMDHEDRDLRGPGILAQHPHLIWLGEMGP